VLNPITFFSFCSAPRLVVRISTIFLALAVLPLLPCIEPSSIICNSICETSGWAFSISSNNNTQFGYSCNLVINNPALSSNPTYPGGEPISFATACFSWYSDISNLTIFTPSCSDNCLAVSVLPQPVGPMNTNDPIGLLSRFNPAWATNTLSITMSIASSWPYTLAFMFFDKLARLLDSFSAIFSIGILTNLDNSYWIDSSFTTLSVCFSFRLNREQAKSIKSIALSGNFLSVWYFILNFTAEAIASSVIVALWYSS